MYDDIRFCGEILRENQVKIYWGKLIGILRVFKDILAEKSKRKLARLLMCSRVQIALPTVAELLL